MLTKSSAQAVKTHSRARRFSEGFIIESERHNALERTRICPKGSPSWWKQPEALTIPTGSRKNDEAKILGSN